MHALFKTRPKPNVNVQLCWISLFSKSSWIKTTASGLSYEIGVYSEKKVNGNWGILFPQSILLGPSFLRMKSGNIMINIS